MQNQYVPTPLIREFRKFEALEGSSGYDLEQLQTLTNAMTELQEQMKKLSTAGGGGGGRPPRGNYHYC